MIIIKNPKLLQEKLQRIKKQGKSIGFVPTMGSLHEGHLSLMRQAAKECGCVVVSIFVNPLQFGPQEDFKRYPRTFKHDAALCKRYVDFLFFPDARLMYPKDFLTMVAVKKLGNVLCGKSRPGHFEGVTTVVNKLLNIVLPDRAYFGQKDAQQSVIIKKMVADLNLPIQIQVLPIIREKDGLAMSSRNRYLSEKERKEAVVLFYALKKAQELIKKGIRDAQAIIATMRYIIDGVPSSRVDYISVVDACTLESLATIKKGALIVLAVFIGKTRLIDNIIVR